MMWIIRFFTLVSIVLVIYLAKDNFNKITKDKSINYEEDIILENKDLFISPETIKKKEIEFAKKYVSQEKHPELPKIEDKKYIFKKSPELSIEEASQDEISEKEKIRLAEIKNKMKEYDLYIAKLKEEIKIAKENLEKSNIENEKDDGFEIVNLDSDSMEDSSIENYEEKDVINSNEEKDVINNDEYIEKIKEKEKENDLYEENVDNYTQIEDIF